MKVIIKEFLEEPIMLMSVFAIVSVLSASIVAGDYQAVTKLIAFILNMSVGILYIYIYIVPIYKNK